MQEKIIIAIGVLIAAFFSFFGWWMENGPDLVFATGNIALCAACWLLNKILSVITDKILD